MKLDLSSLVQTIQQLEKSLSYAQSEAAKNDPELFEQFRNSVIQCFEYTYENSFKMLKRELEKNVLNIDSFDFRDLIREAAERELISNIKNWFDYKRCRNMTSHTYDQDKAEEVYAVIPEFLQDVKALLRVLEERNR
ncbi:MAG: nucleotidyltransferase substrate binding protein [Proteobacteria bacterium]|nr:nucleotidyltransferase substrate binding protein [Pseudomonadota bacterium]